MLRRTLNRTGIVKGNVDRSIVKHLDNYPRDELLRLDEQGLYDVVLGIMRLGERQHFRLMPTASSASFPA